MDDYQSPIAKEQIERLALLAAVNAELRGIAKFISGLETAHEAESEILRSPILDEEERGARLIKLNEIENTIYYLRERAKNLRAIGQEFVLKAKPEAA
ncbi:MAG: hypothetical protein AAFY26_09440 [Cyanobacteria bacterium J06638_22]